MKIEHLISIDATILMVYYTSEKCYQYAIIFGDGLIYQPDEIYYTGEKALKVGRESIELLGNYLLLGD